MPVVRIDTNVTDRAVRRSVTQALSSVFLDLGLSREHITTIFQTLSDSDIYVADTPLSDEVGAGTGFALVRVGMSAARDDRVRRSLAAAVTAGFDGAVERRRVAVDFVDREARDVYIADVPLARRDTAAAGSGPGAPWTGPVGLAGADVRQALIALGWPESLHDARADTRLGDVAPAHLGEWDSLAAASTAAGLEESLGMRFGSLDTSTQGFRTAFGPDATLNDLLVFVAAVPR